MNQTTFDSGCKVNSRLKLMKPIFEKWIQHNETFHKFHAENEDSLFFYGERPSVSTLAAAAWSVKNGYAVQEYYSEKKVAPGKKKTNKKGKTKYGREDLFLGIGNGKPIRFEAKCDFVNAHSRLQSGLFHKQIENCIDSAREDTKKMVEGDRCVALTIINFHSLVKNMNDDLIARTAKAVKNIQTEAKAWYFVSPGVEDNYSNRIHTYFGAALFISPRLRK